MTVHPYTIVLRPLAGNDGGGWLAEVPDLAGCMSDGDTPAAAAEAVQDAISCWLEAAIEDDRPVPAPSVSAA